MKAKLSHAAKRFFQLRSEGAARHRRARTEGSLWHQDPTVQGRTPRGQSKRETQDTMTAQVLSGGADLLPWMGDPGIRFTIP